MNDTQKSAWGVSLISRRRMLRYGLAGIVGIAGGGWPVSATGGGSVYTISTQSGEICFTYETLVMIRQNLLEVLKQQDPSDDYAYLISEIETGNAQPMIFTDSAHIGRWKIINGNDTLILETQRI